MDSVNILVADDHQLVIDGIRLMLLNEEDLNCCAEANNGKQVLELLETTSIDLVLIDINMPILNGLETCKIIRQKYPDIPVIVLSMLEEASMIKLAIKNGASAYLLKNAAREEVLKAIRAVLKGEKYFSADVSEIIMSSLSGRETKKKSSPFLKLSRREKQVLALIIEEYTTAEIAEKLFIGFGTVETHRRNLLVKLGARNTAGLVRISLEYNLLEE